LRKKQFVTPDLIRGPSSSWASGKRRWIPGQAGMTRFRT
jgi:hypothetical protein